MLFCCPLTDDLIDVSIVMNVELCSVSVSFLFSSCFFSFANIEYRMYLLASSAGNHYFSIKIAREARLDFAASSVVREYTSGKRHRNSGHVMCAPSSSSYELLLICLSSAAGKHILEDNDATGQ